MSELNIRRVLLFAFILLVLRSAGSALTFDSSENSSMVLAGYALDSVIVLAVFSALARIQLQLIYLHVFLVAALHEVVGLVIVHTLVGPSPEWPYWWVDWTVFVLSVLFGVQIGLGLRKRSVSKA